MDLESQLDDTIVGLLTSTDSGLSIGQDPRTASLYALITLAERESFRLGEYLCIPFFDSKGNLDENLLCEAIELSYHNEFPHEFGTYDTSNLLAEELINQSNRIIQEIDYNFIAKLLPLSLIHNNNRKPANRLPQPASRVYRADENTIKIGLNLSKKLEDIFVGHISNSPPGSKISYRFKDREMDVPLLFTHVLVAGGTGSGKTQATKNILRQCLGDQRTYEIKGSRKKLAIVQFDPQDEYAQMYHDGDDLTADNETYYKDNQILFNQHKDTRVFVPDIKGTKYQSEYHEAETIPFSIPFSLVRTNHWLISRGGLNENQRAGLINHLLPDFFNKTKEDECTYSNFLAFLDQNKDDYIENGDIYLATFGAIRRKVAGLSNVFFDSGSPPITDLLNEFVKPGRLSVVPTSHINDHRDTTLAVLALSTLLIDQKITSSPDYGHIKETPLVISMDEAHNFLSQGSTETEQEDLLIQKFINAAKQGRKELLGLFLVTQDPHDIAADILSQINTKVILNLSEDSAIRSLKLPDMLKWKVPNLPRGNMVIHSPSYAIPTEVTGLSHCLVRHRRRI
ncbi:MAG: ATP-binding protein [Halobacteriales archaeon]|tara:strand:+ start:284 stop:1987 length:1704 start_codon:yes stop_codon:yes gene_type:complete